MNRDKLITIKVSELEKIQINNYYKSNNLNLSDEARKYLLEKSAGYEPKIESELDILNLFEQFIKSDEVAKYLYNQFTKQLGCNSSETKSNNRKHKEDENEGKIFWDGNYYTHDEIVKIEAEYKKNNG